MTQDLIIIKLGKEEETKRKEKKTKQQNKKTKKKQRKKRIMTMIKEKIGQ